MFDMQIIVLTLPTLLCVLIAVLMYKSRKDKKEKEDEKR